MKSIKPGSVLAGLLVVLAWVAIAASSIGLAPVSFPLGDYPTSAVAHVQAGGASPSTSPKENSQSASSASSGTPAALNGNDRSASAPVLARSPTAAPTSAVPAPPPATPQVVFESAPAATSSATGQPSAVPSATPNSPAPDSTAALVATPNHPTRGTAAILPADDGEIIGYSIEERPILAHRFGQGPLKVVLVGDIHGAFEANTHVLIQQLLAHLQAHPEEVPTDVSLWLIPTMNPDGLATGHRWNANDVDLNRNADTDLDGCGGNDWAHDTVGREGVHAGAGGPYPFSEPESRAVRDFLKDARIAVFYHSAAGAIYLDTCQHHLPTARLAQALSEGSGYPVPAEGWSGYRITGDFGDYLAGEGVAAVTLELTNHEDPEFDRNLEGLRSVLSAIDDIVPAEATEVGAQHVWLDDSNTGVWQYPAYSFLHPLAMELLDDRLYLIDGGRVLGLDLAQPSELRLHLTPGQSLESIPVLEPLDLASDAQSLLALDRVGDVYRYDPATEAWSVERYDRPAGTTSDHYFVALSAGGDYSYLLETSREQVWRFTPGQKGAPWAGLPQRRDIDLSIHDNAVYVLTRAMNTPRGYLDLFRDGRRVTGFQPNVDLMHPRQVMATDGGVYVLDRAGRRLLALEPENGNLLISYEFPDRRAVSTMAADPSGRFLLLGGRDSLYFVGAPDRQATVASGPSLEKPQPHELVLLEQLRGLQMPIKGARITRRDFQMPGAPRHYRLGIHEGLDFYEHTVGVPVNGQTPVLAVAGGVVIRALQDYRPLTANQAATWASETQRQGYTPAEVLDGYRGRQVWIEHGDGLISRYAHLSSIAPDLTEGTRVERGQVIGTAGNSGTPSSVTSRTDELHLHFELWIGDHYAGQFLRPIETREWLERILR